MRPVTQETAATEEGILVLGTDYKDLGGQKRVNPTDVKTKTEAAQSPAPSEDTCELVAALTRSHGSPKCPHPLRSWRKGAQLAQQRRERTILCTQNFCQTHLPHQTSRLPPPPLWLLVWSPKASGPLATSLTAQHDRTAQNQFLDSGGVSVSPLPVCRRAFWAPTARRAPQSVFKSFLQKLRVG